MKKIIDFKWWFVLIVKITGFIPIMLFLRPKYYYPDKKTKKEFKRTPCIIASNHSSMTDPFMMVSTMYFKRLSIIATQELFKKRGLRLLFTLFRAIPIDKEGISLSTFKKASNVIKDGHSVGIFPEGTVAHDKDTIIQYKSGVILMSMMCKAPIYPMYLVKRSNIFRRYRVIIGNRFDIDTLELNGKTKKEKMEEAASLLREQELLLEEQAKQIKK